MSGGGAERQLSYLAGELGQLGWDVHVALTGRGANWERLQASGAVIHEVTALGSHDSRIITRLRRLIARLQPDLVQLWLLQMHVFGGLAAIASQKRWIVTERNSEKAYPPTFKVRLRTAVARFASAIVANSEAGRDYWTQKLGARVRCFVIPNSLPLESIASAPRMTAQEMGIDPTVPLILFAGRLEPQKNIPVLLDALRHVGARRRMQARLFGEGSLRASIEAWIHAEDPAGRIRLSEYTPNLWSVMKGATLFVLPSTFEGCPNVVLEAMACGVPLVVSDIPAHRELLDGASAFLFEPASSTALASAIETILDDPAAAAERAEVAKRRIERWMPDTSARRYSDLYSYLLST
jgi:glycosyltransferase involved in cell wall biosynthesis